MADTGDPNGDGETDEDRKWREREHRKRFDAVTALERRLSLIETAIREGFLDNKTKFELVLAGIQGLRDDNREIWKQWGRRVDREVEMDKRVAALEQKPRRGKAKR